MLSRFTPYSIFLGQCVVKRKADGQIVVCVDYKITQDSLVKDVGTIEIIWGANMAIKDFKPILQQAIKSKVDAFVELDNLKRNEELYVAVKQLQQEFNSYLSSGSAEVLGEVKNGRVV